MATHSQTLTPEQLENMKAVVRRVVDSIDLEELARILNQPAALEPLDISHLQTKNFGYDWDCCVICSRDVGGSAKRIALSPQDFCAHDPALLDDQEKSEDLELGEAFVGVECAKKIPAAYFVGA